MQCLGLFGPLCAALSAVPIGFVRAGVLVVRCSGILGLRGTPLHLATSAHGRVGSGTEAGPIWFRLLCRRVLCIERCSNGGHPRTNHMAT
jgi:hypothetical protein